MSTAKTYSWGKTFVNLFLAGFGGGSTLPLQTPLAYLPHLRWGAGEGNTVNRDKKLQGIE